MKHIILICVLNTSFKQTTMIKTQDTAFNYIEMLKMKSNLIVKVMLKWIECEITILWCECSSLNRKKIKSAKIVKTVNTKIENNDKRKMIAARKFFNKNIMLMLNSVEIKTHMMKKTDWASVLKSKTCVIKIYFIIIIKHVIKNVISQSDQKIIVAEINAQNFRIHNVMKILHVKHNKKNI